MDTVSRGDWSRASNELCRAASFRERAARCDDAPASPQSRCAADRDALLSPPRTRDDGTTSSTPADGYGTASLDDVGHRQDGGASQAEKDYRRQSSAAAREACEEGTAMVRLAVPVIVTYLFEVR